jgi:hypothetical protein
MLQALARDKVDKTSGMSKLVAKQVAGSDVLQ